jgi:Rv0078B-related antitoxin
MPADARGVYPAFRAAVSPLRERRAASGRTPPGQAPEATRLRAALEMHELGVRMYRQRMHREHPRASGREIDAMITTWLAEHPHAGRLRLPSREQHRDIG